jgi:hypothetical protein
LAHNPDSWLYDEFLIAAPGSLEVLSLIGVANPQARPLLSTLSVPVRDGRRSAARAHGHIADRVGIHIAIKGCSARSAAIPMDKEERSVKPSAKPTLVRTQHLPPHITPGQVACGEIIAADCRGCAPIWAGALSSSDGVVSVQVRALRPGSRWKFRGWVLPGAVEQWLS